METIGISITRDQLADIFVALKALTDSMAAILADNVADKEKESNKERDVHSVIKSLSSTMKLDTTNTNIDTLSSNNKNNNINIITTNRESDSEKSNLSNSENSNPTVEEVVNYVNSCGYNLDPKKFYLYYKNNGWKTKSGVNMKERWREFVDMWAKSEVNKPIKASQTGMGSIQDRHASHPFVPTTFE